MHRLFRERLDDATGTSEYVVALNVDVRGFSEFNRAVGDADTAQYIRKLYMRLVDDYFSTASFFKPTGDGLLVTLPYTEATLESTARFAVETSLRIVEDFGTLLAGDPMITFDIPQNVGIGVARGSTMCLRSGETVLDYSGRVLNMASRLMGIARPAGVVIEESFRLDLLEEDVATRFKREDGIFLPGVAEVEPVSVYVTSDLTEVPPAARHPIREYEWGEFVDQSTMVQLEQRPAFWWYRNLGPISDERQISVKTYYPLATASGRRGKGSGWLNVAHDFIVDAGEPGVRVNTKKMAEELRGRNVKENWPLRIVVRYPTY